VSFDFTGKVAAVTGGASGIGLALAERFAAEGAAVAVADANAERVREVADRLPDALAVQVDVSDPAQLQEFAARTAERFGGVHILAANAGIIGPVGPRLWEVSDADWRRVVDVNLLGVVNTLRAFVPLLLQNPPGHVTITSSMAGVTLGSTMPAYWATKHALVAVAESLRLQLERDEAGVGVSVLLPARVTSNLEDSITEGADASAGVPGFRPREITPAEVATVVVDAIRTNRLYVFTHAEGVDRVRSRVEGILGAFDALD
jgi:NAD(P)-dependent dehydrogenase (short-subunit alcohol dehydrogenase family)